MPNITKRDLIQATSDKTGLTQVDTGVVLEGLLEAISSSLKQGRNIEIRGFGRFKLKKRNAREARNPRTGEKVNVEAGIKPIFKASRELIKRVDMAWAARELVDTHNPPQSK
jgi:DNA-binding protein HU-beta/integration host factor subunit beta